MNESNTVNFGNITSVQIKYVEMERQLIRINEVGDALVNSLNNLIYGINKLAGLVGAETINGNEITCSVNSELDSINQFARGQMKKYTDLNTDISTRINDLKYLVGQIF